MLAAVAAGGQRGRQRLVAALEGIECLLAAGAFDVDDDAGTGGQIPKPDQRVGEQAAMAGVAVSASCGGGASSRRTPARPAA